MVFFSQQHFLTRVPAKIKALYVDFRFDILTGPFHHHKNRTFRYFIG